MTARFDLIVVAASLGGLGALSVVLAGLPAGFDVPLVLAQHRLPGSDDAAYVRLLQTRTAFPVRVARHGESALAPGIAVIPAGHDATLDPSMRYRLTEADHGHALTGDRLFTSAARAAGAAVVGVVLTGRLHDGTEGVRAIKRAGGRVLAQDPRTARAPQMPISAIATGCVDHVLPAHRIAAALVALTMAPGAAELLAVPPPAWAQLIG